MPGLLALAWQGWLEGHALAKKEKKTEINWKDGAHDNLKYITSNTELVQDPKNKKYAL